MYIGCWNVRGLNDPLKHSKLHHLVQKERMALLGLIQTQVRERKFGYVGMLMWLRWIWWVVWVRLFMFVLLYWIPILTSMPQSYMKIIVHLKERLYKLIL
jgi:hypothetical protein